MFLGGCITSGTYSFQADLYTKRRTPDSTTGQLKTVWQKWQTVDCLVSPFTSTSFKAQGANEVFAEVYEYLNYLKIKTSIDLGRNLQVTNIRNKLTQVSVYVEKELKGSPPTWYNTQGSSPIIDPFGRVIQYDTLLVRAEEQGEHL
jgi:hypothetical protein